MWEKLGPRRQHIGGERSREDPGPVWWRPGIQSGSSFCCHAVFTPGAKTGAGIQLPLCHPCCRFSQRLWGASEVLRGAAPNPVSARVRTGGQGHSWQHEQGSSPLLPGPSGPHTSWRPFCACCSCPQANVSGLSEEVPVRQHNHWFSVRSCNRIKTESLVELGPDTDWIWIWTFLHSFVL